MKHLSIDIETRSSVDIGKAGAYAYAMAEDFQVLLFAYMVDDNEVIVIDLAMGEKIPDEIIDAMFDENVLKHAYNASFEWWCLSRYFEKILPLNQWRDTMLHAMYCGYPASLKGAGEAMGLPQDKQKLTTGKALIRYFCNPCKPTKSNGGRTWNNPDDDREKWELFKEYNAQDVVTEHEILRRLEAFPVPAYEQMQWELDVKMNAFGVNLDMDVVNGALEIDAIERENLISEAINLTGLVNPNSVQQLTGWLSKKTGRDIDNLRKATVAEELERDDLPNDVRRVLEIRQMLGKTSIKKYEAMNTAKCPDGRIRGILQFYGANRTGRWAGRLVQLHNLPRNYLTTLDEARQIIKDKNHAGLKLLYGNVPDTLSQLIRTAFIPSKGNKFVVSDFSAIEARVIAWLAGEEWVNEVFATTGKIYEATASQMFGVPVELIKKGNPEYSLRQKGKVATLALGYQGGTSALIAMGALDMGLSEDELPDIVHRWRNANPHIKKLWGDIEKASIEVMETAEPRTVRGLKFELVGDLIYGQTFFTVQLPSGRKLYYPKPHLKLNRFEKYALHYYSIGANKKWSENSTYGGKLTENIVQAIARDCLAVTIERIAKRGYQIVFHVHDEVIVDAPQEATLDELCAIMAEPIPWAPGLILKGAGFENNYYMKD